MLKPKRSNVGPNLNTDIARKLAPCDESPRKQFSRKYEWADGLREAAALVVLINHTQFSFFGDTVNYQVIYTKILF